MLSSSNRENWHMEPDVWFPPSPSLLFSSLLTPFPHFTAAITPTPGMEQPTQVTGTELRSTDLQMTARASQ